MKRINTNIVRFRLWCVCFFCFVPCYCVVTCTNVLSSHVRKGRHFAVESAVSCNEGSVGVTNKITWKKRTKEKGKNADKNNENRKLCEGCWRELIGGRLVRMCLPPPNGYKITKRKINGVAPAVKHLCEYGKYAVKKERWLQLGCYRFLSHHHLAFSLLVGFIKFACREQCGRMSSIFIWYSRVIRKCSSNPIPSLARSGWCTNMVVVGMMVKYIFKRAPMLACVCSLIYLHIASALGFSFWFSCLA